MSITSEIALPRKSLRPSMLQRTRVPPADSASSKRASFVAANGSKNWSWMETSSPGRLSRIVMRPEPI
jgi:hypothetical protein